MNNSQEFEKLIAEQCERTFSRTVINKNHYQSTTFSVVIKI